MGEERNMGWNEREKRELNSKSKGGGIVKLN